MLEHLSTGFDVQRQPGGHGIFSGRVLGRFCDNTFNGDPVCAGERLDDRSRPFLADGFKGAGVQGFFFQQARKHIFGELPGIRWHGLAPAVCWVESLSRGLRAETFDKPGFQRLLDPRVAEIDRTGVFTGL